MMEYPKMNDGSLRVRDNYNKVNEWFLKKKKCNKRIIVSLELS